MDFYESILNLSKMILVPVFSTYIGASFAFKNQKKKQIIDDEKDKLVTALSWFLEAENCLLSVWRWYSPDSCPQKGVVIRLQTG
ncbi:hypothetical protein [Aeromonas sp. JL9]|uniref:hypothetical protein n=1 Tax=Aeromonas sp. JL9 TaxID=2950549 RepID=UPI002109AB6D|nr:hypothetical protein [Aeromonas sp. JL9]MCQ4111005.1 hypothetical protein [Aeromonas sp. JL9]